MLRAPEARLKARVRVVEHAGARELRVDGALMSSIRPGGPTTHPVWEALGAPLIALAEVPRSILLLGLGGGAVAQVARALVPGARIVAIDSDSEVVAVARRHFGLDALGVEVVVGDARAFLEGERRAYDAILEDIFVGPGRTVHKPDWLPEPGLSLALARLDPEGFLACNTIHERLCVERALLRQRPSLVEIAFEDYVNHILVAGPASWSAGSLRRALAAQPRLRRTLPQLTLRTLRSRPRSR